MRKAAALSLLLIAACGQSARPDASPANEFRSESVAPPHNETEPGQAAPAAKAPARPPDGYPGVAEMSPSQRRAYERGYRDCRSGRYEAPDAWAEAYRIGCAAAQEAG